MCFKRKKKKKEKLEFSKVLLIQESGLVWITTLAFIVLAYISITNDYIGDLPWLVALVTAIWTAYGVSQGFYYNKAKSENLQGGIRYLSVANELGIIEKDNSIIEEEDMSAGAEG